jgi:hypothetical protein
LTIFLSIASYRDPELFPTIQDCLAKARHPDQLRFGVCWQHGIDDEKPQLLKDPRISVLDIDWRLSKGPCWARAEIMKLWRGEDYYLQIDSHHRFVSEWDLKLIKHAALTDSMKPILTTYCPSYRPGVSLSTLDEPTSINFSYFTSDGIPMYRSAIIPSWEKAQKPVRGRFISAHFLFAAGAFVEEIPYDPDLYFHGEEITLAIRAYTWGYDFFHPTEVLLWHEYSREYRPKHWDDHVDGAVDLPWYKRDQTSRKRVRHLLTDPYVGYLACGSARTVAQYEEYAGISLRHAKVQDSTRLGDEPPNPTTMPDWSSKLPTWRLRIEFECCQLRKNLLMETRSWHIAIYESGGAECDRIFLDSDALAKIRDSEVVIIDYELETGLSPSSWRLWSVSREGDWLATVGGSISAKSLKHTRSIL